MKRLEAIVLGATGATGQELVKLLLKDPNFSKVTIFVRKKPRVKHKKLTIYEIDFSRLNEYKGLINGDVIFSALGTTLSQAGSKTQQYLVDFNYQYEFAKIGSENKVIHYSLVSSVGANIKSPFFYPKTKGALEEAVKKLGFNNIYIFQPPFLIRQSNLIRPGEKIALKILKLLNQIGILKSQKPISVSDLAQKMISEIKSDKTVRLKTFKPRDIF
ncbi:MAG: semialdehyde dehydrogenase [Flavobacteriaceae bacterium]|nr:semialdehyde dehydrogenase [Flavobacteriaceae bacterium]|tara:strand:- start:6425 stop:7072 length:648 start_codon:yes stop_codon:yes gene_type:complete